MFISVPILLYLRCYLRSLIFTHAFLPSPTTSRAVTRALEGAKRLFGSPSVPRKIITKFILQSLIALTFSSSVSFVTFRTVWRIVIEFYGLLRFSEVSQLTFSDITYTDIGFDIYIAKSKTDQTRKGSTVSVSSQFGSSWCPVALTRRYFSRLGYKSGHIMPSSQGEIPDPKVPLKYHVALRDLRSALTSIGIDPTGYGEHSGRRSGTTAAASKGASITELMIQGRWRTESMPRLYTDNALKSKRTFAKRLATF